MPKSSKTRVPESAKASGGRISTKNRSKDVNAPASLKPVARGFYARDPRIVARELLGKVLIRRERNRSVGGRIVETEAYLGTDDPAAHSASGKTARNAVLFGPPGHAYVYFIYGMNYCLNVSCMEEGDAGCVLLRALEPLFGLAEMAEARRLDRDAFNNGALRHTQLRQISSGPGRLAQALQITRERDNGKDMGSPDRSDLWIGDDGWRPDRITETPRVGITKAVEHHFRYVIAGSPFVSGKRVG